MTMVSIRTPQDPLVTPRDPSRATVTTIVYGGVRGVTRVDPLSHPGLPPRRNWHCRPL